MTKFMNKFSLFFLFNLFTSSLSYGPFPIKFIGNSLSLDAYNNLTFCDANSFIEYASYDSINPCERFEDFTCGTFYNDRAWNERYEYIGFRRNYELRNDEKRHRVFKKPSEENEGKAVQIVKNFFRCINWCKF